MAVLALLALVGGSLASSALLLHRAASFLPRYMDVGRDLREVEVFEARLAPVKHYLPPTATIGYLSPRTAGATRRDPRDVRTDVDAQMAVYALAPRIVLYTPDRDLVLANFPDRPPRPEVLSGLGLAPVMDFGNGLMLLRRPPR